MVVPILLVWCASACGNEHAQLTLSVTPIPVQLNVAAGGHGQCSYEAEWTTHLLETAGVGVTVSSFDIAVADRTTGLPLALIGQSSHQPFRVEPHSSTLFDDHVFFAGGCSIELPHSTITITVRGTDDPGNPVSATAAVEQRHDYLFGPARPTLGVSPGGDLGEVST